MLNQSILIGRLTRDPKLTQTATGDDVLHFTLAVNRPRPKKVDDNVNKAKQNADFIPCVAWQGKAKDIADNCKKGSKICVKGAIRSRVITVDDGSTRTIVELKVDTVEFLDPKSKDNASASDDNGVFEETELEDMEIPL